MVSWANFFYMRITGYCIIYCISDFPVEMSVQPWPFNNLLLTNAPPWCTDLAVRGLPCNQPTKLHHWVQPCAGREHFIQPQLFLNLGAVCCWNSASRSVAWVSVYAHVLACLWRLSYSLGIALWAFNYTYCNYENYKIYNLWHRQYQVTSTMPVLHF